MHIGIHATWDVYNCNKEKLSFVPYIKNSLHKITATLDLEELNEAFKQFDPVGVTGFILLAESHISIHTWPEHNYAAVDVFSCKAFDASLVTKLLEKLFESDLIELNQLNRGALKLVQSPNLTAK